MKAIQISEFGGPEVLKVADLPLPVAGPGEVVVKVIAAGVNPVDTYIREGAHATAPPLPFTPGKDGAGVVEKTGKGVSDISPGDRVYLAGSISGTYAGHSLCKAEHVWPLPDNVSFEQGAGVFVPYATAYRALFEKANAKRRETVLIHGASGAVGIAAIQWAKRAGLEVLATAGSEKGRDLVREAGAGVVFDHTSEPEFAYLDLIAESAGGGVDIILEMLANKNLQEDFRALRRCGRIVVIGSRGTLEFNPRAAMTKEATIYGMSLFNASKEVLRGIHEAIYDGLAKGDLSPVVGRRYALSEAAEAHKTIIEDKAYGKIVLLT